MYVITALSHSLRDSLLITGRNSSGSVAYDSIDNQSFKFSVSVAGSTPRNTGGTEHEMEKDGRNNDSVSPHHDTNVIWEVRNPSTHRRQLLKRGQELQSPEIAADKKKFRDTSFPRVPIQSNV